MVVLRVRIIISNCSFTCDWEERSGHASIDSTKTNRTESFNTVQSVRCRATTRVKIVRWAQSDAQPWYTVDRGKFRKLVLLNDGVWLCARDASRWSLFLFDDSLEILSPVRGGVRSEGERRRIAWHEAYESLAEARRNTERNARAANLGLPSLAATKRHYPRLDTLATLSLLPLPLAIPLCHSTPSSRFFFLFRTNVLSLSLSFFHLSCSRFTDLASFSNSRDLCT